MLDTRYARHLALPEIGEAGQQKLLRSSILVVGAGGLGAPVLLYLAAAGVGKLGAVDDDRVSLSNLQRQILYETGDVGRSKLRAAEEQLSQRNPDITFTPHTTRLSAKNAKELIAPYDLVIDCSDNFSTRYAINDACHRLGTPWIYGAASRFSGLVSCFTSYAGPDHPCYRCWHPTPPAADYETSCASTGIVGALTGIIGSMQALEAIKLVTGAGTALSGRMLRFDGLQGTWRESELPKDPACPLCQT